MKLSALFLQGILTAKSTTLNTRRANSSYAVDALLDGSSSQKKQLGVLVQEESHVALFFFRRVC